MGYFRILYYISYIFNTICRIIKRNKKLLLFILIFVVLLIYSNKSNAAYEGNYDYADPNLAFEQMYDDICMRFIKRYSQTPDSELKTSIANLIKDRNYKHYIYFSGGYTTDGSSMMNQFNYDDSFYYIIIIPSYGGSWTRQLNSDTYMTIPNISCSTYTFTDPGLGEGYRWKLFRVKTNTIEQISLDNGFKVYMPSNCFGMVNKYIYNYFFNNYSLEQIEVLKEINDNLDTVTNDEIETETETETDSVISDSTSIFDNSYSNDLTSYNNSFLSTINNAINTLLTSSNVKTITLTLPFVNQNIVLRGDMIKSHILNTSIYTYIQLFWWVAFSIPIFVLLRRIIVWLGTGEFLNKPSKFATYMSNFISTNITPGMM